MSSFHPEVLTLLIVEDHELVRQGLCYTLAETGFEKIYTACDGEEALEKGKELLPDIVLMDIGLPKLNGIEATQKLKAFLPQVKVIMLTSHQQSEDVLASLSAGADGYAMKDISMERLSRVIEEVMDGAMWLDPAVAGVLNQVAKQCEGSVDGLEEDSLQEDLPSRNVEQKSDGGRQRYNHKLTEREMDVLQCIVDGQSNKEIAVTLKMSPHTVKSHVTNIIQKMSVSDRTQAAVKAIQSNLV